MCRVVFMSSQAKQLLHATVAAQHSTVPTASRVRRAQRVGLGRRLALQLSAERACGAHKTQQERRHSWAGERGPRALAGPSGRKGTTSSGSYTVAFRTCRCHHSALHNVTIDCAQLFVHVAHLWRTRAARLGRAQPPGRSC